MFPIFIPSPTDGYLGIVTNTAMPMGVQIPLPVPALNSSVYDPEVGQLDPEEFLT